MVAEPTAAATPLSARELEEEARQRGFDRSTAAAADTGADTHLPASESDMLKNDGHGGGSPAPTTMLPPD